MPSTRKIAAVLVLGLLGARASGAESVILKYRKTLYFSGNPDEVQKDDKKKLVKLNAPEGVGCDDRGAVVVADTGNGRLVLFRNADGQWSSGVEVKVPELPYPTRAQIDSKGNIVVLDRKTRKLVRLNSNGVVINAIEFKGLPDKTSVVPASFKLDRSDNLCVLDVGGQRVLVADPTGNVTRSIPLPGGHTDFTDVAVDGSGMLYAVDSAEDAVWSANGKATSFAPLGKSLKDYMNFASYITTNNKGTLLVVDQNGHGVVLLGSDGSYLGRQLTMGWSDGYLYYPGQLCITSNGTAAIADRGNNRVEIFSTGK